MNEERPYEVTLGYVKTGEVWRIEIVTAASPEEASEVVLDSAYMNVGHLKIGEITVLKVEAAKK